MRRWTARLPFATVYLSVHRDNAPEPIPLTIPPPRDQGPVRSLFGTLRNDEVCFILRRGNNHHTMSITFNTHLFPAEATSVASALPCRQSFDTKLRTGYVLALAGGRAR
jgi:hypothetical protein